MITRISDYNGLSSSEKLDLVRSVNTMEYLERMLHEAFQNKGGELWSELQFQLFGKNMQLMERGFGLGSFRSEIDWEFRNTIERVEQQYTPQETVPENIQDLDTFMPWLKDKIAKHRVNHHSLFDYFDADDLSDEEVRYFLANYRVNMQRFHMHVAAYSLFVPFEMREELYHNLYDEFGNGDFRKAHPNLFEPLMEHFGGAFDEDVNAETCHLLNTKINLCWFSQDLYGGLGGMGALELSIPAQQKRVLAHLRRRGLSEELVQFFVLHCELDEEHGEGWFAAGMPYMKTRTDYQKVFAAAMRMLEARAGVYDGVLAGILQRRGLPSGRHGSARSGQDMGGHARHS